jgi:aryl-alcohol dehydrogenase-like predicted oxidoreductase
MKYLPLSTTGQQISAVGFGGMPLSIQGRPPEEKGKRALHAAIDAGMNFIDTADAYCLSDDDIGQNERLIASALAERADRDRIMVATKGGFRRPGGAWIRDASPEHLREACENSLRALGVDRIFLYQLHAVDPAVPFEQSVETLARLQREGKILHAGLSNVSVEQIEAARKIIEVVSVQNRLNPFFREALQNGVVRHCDEQNIIFIAYSPVGGGRLAKKLPRYLPLQRIAEAHGSTPHAVTIAWVRAQGRSVVPIPGARQIEHAVDSARAADLTLAEEEIAAIDATRFSTA